MFELFLIFYVWISIYLEGNRNEEEKKKPVAALKINISG